MMSTSITAGEDARISRMAEDTRLAAEDHYYRALVLFSYNRHELAVEAHFIDTNDPVVAVCLSQRSSVIQDVPFAGGWRVQDRMMASAGSDRWILLQNLSNAIERPER